ncbi:MULTISPECIES: acetyl-CoA carboxylase biotin carboxyl carrier protein [Staphylococcus]|uniref:Acetyl-CoA carboxylase biotin carboxyl carrier protein subunit n=1 Tax=Staphylococcus succinus TaxID=61015 RepID=A0ABX5IST5_9STAP|nr:MULTISPECIES: biotin/lipoyl-containing protein [Staphylococcus]MDH9161749.1 acetyl-CoA carboxylase biotin carboxyl carrier protein subunit [Staphylococcus succinus]MEB8124725.1 acetyl-CoA carboxylase biotin carboxyl carrier protein subunit [Staphylococcus succinus]OIJ29632.1 acetyl-CoA carboxylase biotin carboxyl carrier protein subunit [Staphylococcus sp. LCT-H4]PNZ16214.1 acetyl-CoA carboxylase biotin carboxyl carrier protein subunit [Staphylococcus succinus subsp. succinus]PTI70611.1 ace
MNIEKIEQLINLVKSNKVKKFKYKDQDSEIELDFSENNESGWATQQSTLESQYSNDSNQVQSVEQFKAVKAPMVGTFFLQDEKELTNPLIKVGDTIKQGDTIGYIEAMKVMNEVTSEVDGVIDEILVTHGSNVEYNQTIVKVK